MKIKLLALSTLLLTANAFATTRAEAEIKAGHNPSMCPQLEILLGESTDCYVDKSVDGRNTGTPEGIEINTGERAGEIKVVMGRLNTILSYDQSERLIPISTRPGDEIFYTQSTRCESFKITNLPDTDENGRTIGTYELDFPNSIYEEQKAYAKDPQTGKIFQLTRMDTLVYSYDKTLGEESLTISQFINGTFKAATTCFKK